MSQSPACERLREKQPLEYGRTGLGVDLPDRNVVKCLQYRPADPLPDPDAALRDRLVHPVGTVPLAELAHRCRDACVIICNVTRPIPSHLLLPVEVAAAEAIAKHGPDRRDPQRALCVG